MSTTRRSPRRCWRPPASRTASTRRSSTARRRPTTCPTRPASRPELKNQLLTQPRHPGRAQGRPGRRLLADASGGQARRHPPARPERDLPRRRRVPRGALRVGRVSRVRDDLGRHRHGACRGPGDRLERQARRGLRQGQRRDPRAHPADPDRPWRDECRLPGRRHGCRRRRRSGSNGFARDGPGRSTPARLADDGRARRPVLRRRDRLGLGAALHPVERGPVRLRPDRARRRSPSLAKCCDPGRRPAGLDLHPAQGGAVPRRLRARRQRRRAQLSPCSGTSNTRSISADEGSFATFASRFGGFLNPPATPGG